MTRSSPASLTQMSIKRLYSAAVVPASATMRIARIPRRFSRSTSNRIAVSFRSLRSLVKVGITQPQQPRSSSNAQARASFGPYFATGEQWYYQINAVQLG